MKNSYTNLLQQSNFNVNYWLTENRNFDYETACQYQDVLYGIKHLKNNMYFNPSSEQVTYDGNSSDEIYMDLDEEELKEILETGEMTEEQMKYIEKMSNITSCDYEPSSDISNIQMVADVVSKIQIERQNKLESKINEFNMKGKYFYSQ